MLRRLGVDVEYYDPHEGAAIERLMKPNTKVVFTESPGSNTFEMQDIPAIARVAREHGAVVMMDNTWATPLYFKPIDHGVDIVIHAATKYPAGHSDVLLGTVSATPACWPALHETFVTMGCCAGPDDVYQVLRGLRTMGVRLDHHQKSTLDIARWLETQPGVARVLHPALESHPGHAIWKRDFCGSSGIFSVGARRRRAQGPRTPSSTRLRSLGSATPGAAMKASRSTSSSAIGPSPRAPMRAR